MAIGQPLRFISGLSGARRGGHRKKDGGRCNRPETRECAFHESYELPLPLKS
jgi:hypothetical protein